MPSVMQFASAFQARHPTHKAITSITLQGSWFARPSWKSPSGPIEPDHNADDATTGSPPTNTNDAHPVKPRMQGDTSLITVPWRKVPTSRRREIILPPTMKQSDVRPIRADTQAKLVTAIARGRLWLCQLQMGAVETVEQIAEREKCSKRHVNMTISLAFLAPDLVTAAVERRLPDGIGVARLFDPPVEWDRQRRMLGLTSSSV